jgi:hypothetical protein
VHSQGGLLFAGMAALLAAPSIDTSEIACRKMFTLRSI